MNEYLGCADSTTLRPVINKDVVPKELLPYILSHETVEVLEMFPTADEIIISWNVNGLWVIW